MEGSIKIDLDKLPIKRLESIDEAGNEQFPLDVGYEEKRLNMVRRIDFSSVVEKDAKKQKSSKEAAGPQAWPWQTLVENLQIAQQELSIILDLISTEEPNWHQSNKNQKISQFWPHSQQAYYILCKSLQKVYYEILAKRRGPTKKGMTHPS